MVRLVFALAAALAASAAMAQALPPPPLNLKLAPAATPAPAASTAASASRGTHPATGSSTRAAPAPSLRASVAPGSSALPDSPPGVYYGDTSGRIYPSGPRVAEVKCDDATYGQPQTHGAVSMGVMGGNHVSGNYQSATINVTKQLGSCEDPKGAMGITINIGQGHFHGPRW